MNITAQEYGEANNLTRSQYTQEIKSLATDLVFEAYADWETRDEVEERINDYMIHDTVDSHQWVIYYSYNNDVIQHSDNADAYLDVYDNESLGQIVTEQGVDQLGTIRAYFAMYQDLSEACEVHTECPTYNDYVNTLLVERIE